MSKLVHWFNLVEKTGLKQFQVVVKTLTQHYPDILNYFNYRSTNASAESFNSKIKYFRMMYRGVREREFFLFRLSKLFA
ncbi:transposase [Myroides sp. LJL119]